MRGIDKIPLRGLWLWASVAVYALKVTRFGVDWFIICALSMWLAQSWVELLVNMLVGWLGLSLAIYMILHQDLPLE